MGPILTIALGIVLGYFLLFLITGLLGMIFFRLFGDRLMTRVSGVINGAVKSINDDNFGFEVNDVTNGTAVAAVGGCAHKIY